MAIAITEPVGDAQRRARRELTIYFAVVVGLTAVLEAIIIGRPDIDGPFIAGLMWVSPVASVVARLAQRERFADVSFRFGGRRTWSAIALVLIFPTIVGLIIYGTAWTTGLSRFGQPATKESK
jgi:preprotein translocase subunit SecE